MAPSHNSTRSRNASRILAMLLRPGRCFGPYAEAVADGAGKLGAVQGVEMEMPDAEAVERPALLDRDHRRNQLSRRRIVVEAIELPANPIRNARAACLGEFRGAGDIGHRQDAGDDRNADPRRASALEKAREGVGVEKELRD